jgi:hypothetical protein
MAESPDCTRHEEEINRLRERSHAHANDLTALRRDQAAISDRIPMNLGQWMGKMDVQIQGLTHNVENIHQALQRGYVTLAEFQVVEKQINQCATKAELEPIKSGFYKGIGVVLTIVIGGLMALLLKG